MERLEDDYAALVLGRWLRDWRLRTGASQRSVARLARIDQGGLSRIERGLAGRPSGKRLARLLVVLDWLSGGGDPAGPFARPDSRRPERLDDDAGPTPPPVVGTLRR
jgi:transcriptional regulator with XRE-family HTH domain